MGTLKIFDGLDLISESAEKRIKEIWLEAGKPNLAVYSAAYVMFVGIFVGLSMWTAILVKNGFNWSAVLTGSIPSSGISFVFFGLWHAWNTVRYMRRLDQSEQLEDRT